VKNGMYHTFPNLLHNQIHETPINGCKFTLFKLMLFLLVAADLNPDISRGLVVAITEDKIEQI